MKCVESGWAYSDVIVFSGASCRAEPEQQLLLPIPDLIRFRREILRKTTDQPNLAIVTASGWLDVLHPVWKTNRRKLVATSKRGYESMMARLLAYYTTTSKNGEDPASTLSQWLDSNQITIKAFESASSDSEMDFVAFSRYLKSDMDATYCDVSAGPTLISLMVKAYVRSLLPPFEPFSSNSVLINAVQQDIG